MEYIMIARLEISRYNVSVSGKSAGIFLVQSV